MGDAGSTPQCCSMHPTNPPHGVRMDPHPAVQQHWGGSTSHLGWTPQIPVPTAACKGECPPGVVSCPLRCLHPVLPAAHAAQLGSGCGAALAGAAIQEQSWCQPSLRHGLRTAVTPFTSQTNEANWDINQPARCSGQHCKTGLSLAAAGSWVQRLLEKPLRAGSHLCCLGAGTARAWRGFIPQASLG